MRFSCIYFFSKHIYALIVIMNEYIHSNFSYCHIFIIWCILCFRICIYCVHMSTYKYALLLDLARMLAAAITHRYMGIFCGMTHHIRPRPQPAKRKRENFQFSFIFFPLFSLYVTANGSSIYGIERKLFSVHNMFSRSLTLL